MFNGTQIGGVELRPGDELPDNLEGDYLRALRTRLGGMPGGQGGGRWAMRSGCSANALWCILGIHFITQFDTILKLRLFRPLWFQ